MCVCVRVRVRVCVSTCVQDKDELLVRLLLLEVLLDVLGARTRSRASRTWISTSAQSITWEGVEKSEESDVRGSVCVHLRAFACQYVPLLVMRVGALSKDELST